MAPACEQLLPSKGNQLAQIWRTKQLIYILMRNSMGRHREFSRVTEDALVCAANTLQLQLTEEKRKQLVEVFFLGQSTYPDVKPGLEALKKQGTKLIVLANGEQKTMEEGAKRVGVLDLFDRFISVEEVKVYKVNPRVYNHGADQLNITNAELGFVAAHSWHIMGAASAGLPTFWINPHRGARGTWVQSERYCQRNARYSSAIARLTSPRHARGATARALLEHDALLRFGVTRRVTA
jgi:2-haloacid dehalogenase